MDTVRIWARNGLIQPHPSRTVEST
ncbi:MAG: hypothetical protein ACL7AX_12555 [Candidatus Arsenophonus phytopathogenicus]